MLGKGIFAIQFWGWVKDLPSDRHSLPSLLLFLGAWCRFPSFLSYNSVFFMTLSQWCLVIETSHDQAKPKVPMILKPFLLPKHANTWILLMPLAHRCFYTKNTEDGTLFSFPIWISGDLETILQLPSFPWFLYFLSLLALRNSLSDHAGISKKD